MEMNTTKSFFKATVTWSIIGFMFMHEPISSMLLGIGAGVAMLAKNTQRYRDLLVRGAGFSLTTLAFILYSGSTWYKWFFIRFSGWIVISYAAAYVTMTKFHNDFVERNFLAFVLVGALFSFMLSYPDFKGVLYFFILFLVSLVVLYLTYAISTYISSLLREKSNLELFPVPKAGTREDHYSKDLKRVIAAFVQKGDKVPLTVFIIRNSPNGISEILLQEIIRPLVEYTPSPISPLLPPWIAEKKAEDEKQRRAHILEEILESLTFRRSDYEEN